MNRAAVLALALLLAPLAGCAGSDGSDDDPASGGDGPANETASLSAPNWSLGDYWTWRSDQVGEVTYAVTGEDGGDWIVDTTNRDVAFFDARFDVSTLGPVRKADLAGSQGDTRVQFFDWPLEPGKTWTTTWDRVEREITVDRVEDGTAHLTARQNGRVAVEYTYDSEVGSFGRLVFVDENGTETFGLRLSDSGSGVPGEPIRWDLAAVVDEEGTFSPGPQSFGFGFEVPENATDLWMDLSIACPSGAYSFGFGPSDGTGSEDAGYSSSQACPGSENETGPVVEDPPAGSYNGGFSGSSPEDGAEYRVLIYVRTLRSIAVGEG